MLEKSAKRQLEHARLTGGSGGLICWKGIERRLGRRIAEQLGEMGANFGEVDLGGLEVTVEV